MEYKFLTPGKLCAEDVELRVLRVYQADGALGYAPYYAFGIYSAATGEKVGNISLRIGSHDALYLAGHIGYGVEPEARGRRYAAKACRALFPFARENGFTSVLITCNPDNGPSRRTCELVGGKLLEIIDVPKDNEMYRSGDRQKCVFEVAV